MNTNSQISLITDKDLLQINATIIAGLFIFLTLSSFVIDMEKQSLTDSKTRLLVENKFKTNNNSNYINNTIVKAPEKIMSSQEYLQVVYWLFFPFVFSSILLLWGVIRGRSSEALLKTASGTTIGGFCLILIWFFIIQIYPYIKCYLLI